MEENQMLIDGDIFHGSERIVMRGGAQEPVRIEVRDPKKVVEEWQTELLKAEVSYRLRF